MRYYACNFIFYYNNQRKQTESCTGIEEDTILDLNQPSNLIAKRIKGLYPWAKAYLYCNGHFLTVRDYKIEDNISNAEPRTVVSKSGREISVATVDNKVITFIDTKLVKTFFLPSTRLFIKFKIGDKI